MIELIVYYIMPNVVLFGGIYGIAKGFEYLVWELIVWTSDKYYSDEDKTTGSEY